MGDEHVHQWSAGSTTTRGRISPSPCSALDDHLWEDVIMVQTCPCGAIRQVLVGFRNQCRRGDIRRRRKGLPPLGQPLPRSGTYGEPRVISTTPASRATREADA